MPVSGSALRGGNKQSYYVLQCAGLVTPTLLSDQLSNRTIEFQGTLPANLVITFGLSYEDAGLSWELVGNHVAAGFTLSVKGPTGGSYILPAGTRTQLLWDGSTLIQQELGGTMRTDPLIIAGITGASPTVTLTDAQGAYSIVVLQGNATASPLLKVTPRYQILVVFNQTAGNVVVGNVAGGATVTVNSGAVGLMANNGTDVTAI